MTAAEKILRKALVASNLDSRQWNSIQAGLRDRAFFSSRVAKANILDALRKRTAEYEDGHTSMSEIRKRMRQDLDTLHYTPEKGTEGTIRDLYSKARLDVIVKQNVATARGFIRWAEGNEPGAYAAFPAQEFKRVHPRKRERGAAYWQKRWTDAGGKIHGGRMIALKDDPVWVRLSIFGTPYPPFDWGSGMGVRDIDRKTTLELGLIDAAGIREKVSALEEKRDRGDLPSMNGDLQATIPMRADTDEFKELKKSFNDDFGDQIQIVNDKVFWTDNLVRDVRNGKIDKARLGNPSDSLLKMMEGVIPQSDIDAYTSMSPNFSKAVFDQHAIKHEGPNERRWTNIPLRDGDFALMPWVWRDPRKVIPVKKHHIVLEFETMDGNYLQLSMNTMRGISSFYKTKMPLEATPGFNPFDPFKT